MDDDDERLEHQKAMIAKIMEKENHREMQKWIDEYTYKKIDNEDKVKHIEATKKIFGSCF